MNVAPSAPTIVQEPENQVVPTGTNIVLAVRAIGSYPLSFQWSFEGTNIIGATNMSWLVENIQQAGTYSVEVTNSEGQANAAAMVLLENTAPWFTSEPVSHRVPEGMIFPVTLKAEIAGAEPWSFQWQRDGTNIPGAAQRELRFEPVSQSDQGAYRLVAGNPFGSVTSRTATLTVPVRSMEGGTEVGWGDNLTGYPFHDSRMFDVQGLTNVVALGGGYSSTLAVTADGALRTWGLGYEGPPPESLSNIVAAAGGLQHSLALTRDGRVSFWGSSFIAWPPVPPEVTNVVAIAAGYSCSLALRADGTVVAWGYCIDGGHMPASLRDVVSISAGETHYLALISDGTVRAWGRNTVGQTNVPAGLSNVIAIAAGRHQSFALKEDGTVIAWGAAGVPEGLTNIIAVAAGAEYAMALSRDGNITAWGQNERRQLDVPQWLRGTYAIHASSVAAYALTRHPVIISNQWPWIESYVGSNVVLRVGASGEGPLSYSWERDGSTVAGATNSVLILSNLQPAQSGRYIAKISNRHGTIASDAVTLHLLPQILAHPTPQIATVGRNATFSVAVTGSEPFLFSWFKNGAAFAYTDVPSITITNVGFSDLGSYSVKVQNSAGAYHSVYSSAASLILVPQLTAGRLPDGFRLSWPTWTNALQLEFAPNLIQQSWRPITLPAGTNSWIMPTTGPQGFYRLMPAAQSAQTVPPVPPDSSISKKGARR